MKLAARFSRYCSVALLPAGGDWLVFAVLVSAVGLPPLSSLMVARIAGGLVLPQQSLLDLGRQSANRVDPARTAFRAALYL